jgi:hypothetical protein
MDGHLDLLGLDAVRAGDATPEQRAHADQCADCRATVDGFRALAARLAPAPIDVPADVTRRILTPPRRVWRPVAAAAAALLLGAAAWFLTRPSIPGDIDRSGRVDIVDAYALSVRLKSGQTDASYDVNKDGKIDDRDVDEIARRSVALK